MPTLVAIPWKSIETSARVGVRWAAHHTGLPALAVAAIVLVVGYRILKKSARFAAEVALVAALLVAATYAGWVRV